MSRKKLEKKQNIIISKKQEEINQIQRAKYQIFYEKSVENVLRLTTELFNFLTGRSEFGKYQIVTEQNEVIEKHEGLEQLNMTSALQSYFNMTESTWKRLKEKYKDWIVEVQTEDGEHHEFTVGSKMSEPEDIIEARIIDGGLKYQYSDKFASFILKSKHNVRDTIEFEKTDKKEDKEIKKALDKVLEALEVSQKSIEQQQASAMEPIGVSFKAKTIEKWPELRSIQKSSRKKRIDSNR